MKCIICNKDLSGRQKLYCSRKCHNNSGNKKHQDYQCQQKRGLERKLRLITLLGSKCSVCGYSKNIAALQFHHQNPDQKETNLDMRKLSNSTWNWCEQEAKKCLLLCANCHAEHHYPHLNFQRTISSRLL
jgi:hypothetical protein